MSDLLRCRPRDRDRRAAQLLAGGWPGPRRVVVGSLTGGAGRSTTIAVMCAAAVDAGVPVLALDATGGGDGELAARAGGGAAAGRDWTRLTGREAEVDFAALRRREGAGDVAGDPVAVITVGGDAGSCCYPSGRGREVRRSPGRNRSTVPITGIDPGHAYRKPPVISCHDGWCAGSSGSGDAIPILAELARHADPAGWVWVDRGA